MTNVQNTQGQVTVLGTLVGHDDDDGGGGDDDDDDNS